MTFAENTNAQHRRWVAEEKQEAMAELARWKRRREQAFARLQRVANAFTTSRIFADVHLNWKKP
jgi:hypothetical protein